MNYHYFTGFFDDAKIDFQQALKLNPDFEDAKMSLQQTIQDQQHKLERGYWQDQKLWATYYYFILNSGACVQHFLSVKCPL